MEYRVNKKELPWIHIARVLACAMVVFLHALPPADFYRLEGADWAYRHLIVVATKPCVPLFLMISGYLILPYKPDDGFMAFYRKRIPRVLFPLLVWSAVYAVLPYMLEQQGGKDTIEELLLSPVKVPQMIGGIMWYLFILIGIYLTIPFLSERVYADKRLCRLYLIIWLATSALFILKARIPDGLLGHHRYEHGFDLTLYFSGYLGFLLLGYYIKKWAASDLLLRRVTFGGNKWLMWLMVALLVAVCCKVDALRKSFLASGSVALSFYVFMLLKDVRADRFPRFYAVLKSLSTWSFGIYLCHMVIHRSLTIRIYEVAGTAFCWQMVCQVTTFVLAAGLAGLLSRLPFKRYIVG